ncbi:hemerythrin domain-containing protein [Kribbella sp. NPDC048915]|uniref:hemerythrin domain-containing protein n=1 Tax=Kribbella sp. NPDC048915 TaxID=3155148 RepID=UPI00340638D9
MLVKGLRSSPSDRFPEHSGKGVDLRQAVVLACEKLALQGCGAVGESRQEMSPDGPADIQDMRIIHSALRRDLERTTIVASDPALLTDTRRQALGEHTAWMMHTLHRHHSGEDAEVWPEMRRRNPAAGALLDRMDADHRQIAEPMDELESVGSRFGAGTADASELLAAVARLKEPLLPHLAREEQEMMPVVAQSMTHREWHALTQRAFVKGKPVKELAMEGHWVLDNAPTRDRDRMVTVLPAVPRWVLLNLMGGPYRRKRETLWAGTPAADLAPLSIDDCR